ncbi:MAG: CPBP family intramembrane metalloprotease [Candidatus Aminicenantes bacterium]|nr:CPBP family intramembrane metalloprotease [Candidatus Aminicenantes bacterium]
MKKTAVVFSEYLGVSFIIAIFGILLHRFLGLENLLTNLAYWLSRGVVIAVVVYAVRRLKDNWTLKDLGFRIHRSWGKDIWFGFIGFCVLYIVLLPLEVANISVYADSISKNLGMFPDMPLPLLLVIMTLTSLIFGFVTGAWHEEIWYRGYIQGLFSRKIAPAVGFFISFIPFGLTHHFSHPDYNVVMILNVLISGAVFCLIYYATGSLLAAMTTHTLANVIPVYAPFVFAKGYVALSYVTAFGLGLILLGFCFVGRTELKELWTKTKQMFSESGILYTVVGFLLGLLVFLIAWGRSVFTDRYGSSIRLVVYAVLGALFLGLSFIRKRIPDPR